MTVQFGYTSLTQPGHTPYNHLIVKEFLTVLSQDLQHGSCDTTSFVPLGTLSCWSGGVRICFMLRASGHWLHVRANSILKFFQVDSTGMFRMTSSARYFTKGVGSSRPNWRWIMCFLECPKANTSCKAWVKCFSLS